MMESAAASAPVSSSPSATPGEEPYLLGQSFGDYVLEQEIAHGGMGVVYRARQLSLGRTVAVKLLLLGRHSSAESIQRFQREARSAAALRHPNIVSIFEVGERDGQHFFSMEFVEGRDLAQRLREGPLPVRQAAEYLRTIALAVHYAHSQGVLHRDLKPSNVLIDAFGEPRLTDFGLAKPLDGSSDLTETGRLLGSPNYLSPEAAAGADALGSASDVYSLGAMFYELLTGRPPFLAQSLQDTLLRIRDTDPVGLRRLNPAVPVDLETICLKCLEKQPDSRYGSAQELTDDLGRWLRNEPISARPVPAWERAWKWSRRNPRVARLLLVTALAGIGVIATLTVANIRIRAANSRTAVEAEQSRRRLVQLNVQTGNRFVADGEPLTALAWFVEALALEHGKPEREDVHRRRIAAVLRQAPELEHLWFHDAFVTDVRLSPDGARLAAVSLEGKTKYWDTRTGFELSGPERAGLVRFSPDNRRLLTWSPGEGARLWNLADGSSATDLPQLLDGAATHFSPNGRWLAYSSSKEVKLVEMATGLPWGEPWRAAHPVTLLLFSPDSQRLAGYDGQGRVTVWNTTSNGAPPRPIELGGPISRWEFRGDGLRLAAVFRDRWVRQWDIVTGQPVGHDLEHSARVFSVQYGPDGQRLATAEWGGAAYLWDAASGQRVGPPLAHQGGVRWALYSPDGRRLATASWDTTVRFWDPETGHPRPPLLRHGGFVTSLRFSPDATRLVTGSQDTAVRLWRLQTNDPARLALWHGETVFRARYSPGSTRIVTAGEDGTARIWDRASGALLLTVRHDAGVIDACFSPDGQRILTGSADGTARVWDAATGEPLFPGVSHGAEVQVAEFSPNGRQFLTRGGGSQVRVWDSATGAPVTPPLDHGSRGSAVAFHPDGTHLLVGGRDGFAQVWDVATALPSGPRLAVGGPVWSVAFSPDGRKILTAWTDDGQLPSAAQLWDASTGAKLAKPMWHLDGIYCAVFSRDGRRIVTCGEDNTARVWDAATAEPVTPPMRHRAYVYSAAFSPDGRLVATASEDGTARIWETETGEAVSPPLNHDGRAGWVGWSPDGREIATGWNQNAGRVFDVSPQAGSVERLRLQAELLASQRLHPTSGAAPLTANEMKERWEAVRRRD